MRSTWIPADSRIAPTRRASTPSRTDVAAFVEVLNRHGVRYAMIGGAPAQFSVPGLITYNVDFAPAADPERWIRSRGPGHLGHPKGGSSFDPRCFSTHAAPGLSYTTTQDAISEGPPGASPGRRSLANYGSTGRSSSRMSRSALGQSWWYAAR